jgi:hypothetical protein
MSSVGHLKEVGITDSRLCLLKHLPLVVLGALILITGSPASAHTLNDFRQERGHVKRRAKRELGVPYTSGGASPSGFDCSGFSRWTFLTHGADLPHSAVEQFRLGRQRGYHRVWKRNRLKRGDLVFFHTTSARVGHVGIYIGKKKFISATSSSGIHIDSVYDRYYWGQRWVGATRVPATRSHDATTSTKQLQLDVATRSKDT